MKKKVTKKDVDTLTAALKTELTKAATDAAQASNDIIQAKFVRLLDGVTNFLNGFDLDEEKTEVAAQDPAAQ